MGRLTPEERRRVFQAQQHASRTMLATLTDVPIVPQALSTSRPALLRLLVAAMIVMLLGGGWLAYRAIEFHPPASVVEALLPRR